MPSRDSGLPHSARDTVGTSGNVFQSLLARERPPSSLFEDSKNLEPLSGRGRMQPQSSAIPTPRFNQGSALLNPYCHTGGTYSLNGMMDYQRFQISEMHLGKFLTQWSFKAGKSTSREVWILISQFTSIFRAT